MSVRKGVAIVATAVVLVVVLTTVAFYVLWSGGENTPGSGEPVTTFRR